ncbi:MAG: DUF421 domain-containing protein [Clostridia bacterium]|nr:DUF421 domain-containing protein [Clostridia bacterium]
MLIIVIRTLILYAVVILSLRIMGKRQIGELQPAELVVAIMISDLATIPMESVNTPLMSGVVPVITLMLAEVILSFMSLKSSAVRRVVVGSPSVVIYDGKIIEREMERMRFNLDDLLEELRINNCPDIADVEVAVIETSGKLSVIPRTNARAATVDDLELKNVSPSGLPCTVIMDGKINEYELKRSGKDTVFIDRMIKDNGARTVKDVFVMTINAEGKLYIQLKDGAGK